MAFCCRATLLLLLLGLPVVSASAQENLPSGYPGNDDSLQTATLLLFAAYSITIVSASLLGGFLPSLVKLTHTRMQSIISLVGGLMLGIGVFHMLPHALVQLGPSGIDLVAVWMMIGMLVMFFLLRTFHFHQHGPADFQEASEQCDHDHKAAGDAHHHDDHNPHEGHGKAHRLSWVGVFLGLALHTLIDGMALGASMEADRAHLGVFALFGVGTFLAILLHKPLDAISIASLMTASGWTSGWKLLVNLAFASMCPLGAALFFLGVQRFVHEQAAVIGCTLAFSAGVLICIALSDLLPEM
ncbi:MAG: ZIP family metal transporter, partial [Pirellulales bacterium]